MASELPKNFDAASLQSGVTRRWRDARAFQARPDARERRYVVMMPLPNVTGALHMGHAMDNVMQDLLIRWHRMRGDNTLWMAGTDHAGIATQAVVERRLFELEGKTRNDIGRDALVARIFEWKDQYQKRIVSQQIAMGCSCDWDRHRFTMDAVCGRAVRHTFFAMFRDGLTYRGHRLVNWDCHLQTAVADDEVYTDTVAGHFWHLRYPVIDPRPGEPEFVVVATTRPETMLGDTAVACHPDPRGALERALEAAREELAGARDRDRAARAAEVERLEARIASHLEPLETLARMARDGRKVRLPLMDREIPLIVDEWAKPDLGSGCVKITPGHDPNDYDVWTRHAEEIDRINILEPDGTLAANAGVYAGIDRLVARERVVADLDAQGLLERVEEREIELPHSDRSKTPIEPYLSTQWFVRMGDVPDGVVLGRGTRNEFRSSGLAQAAIDAVRGDWRSASGRKLVFQPDPVRYGNTYLNWLDEKRDWCISRQLWWGHRIPVWRAELDADGARAVLEKIRPLMDRDDVCVRFAPELGESRPLSRRDDVDEPGELQVCLEDAPVDHALGADLEAAGLVQDPDVLDTWFSSGLWPHSTLGWPDPATAQTEEGQLPLFAQDGFEDCLSYYYPGSCLVTARDIITLWVVRMVMMGLYNLGDLPFTDCFIHATILDGKGVRMSKSKGNGIDPVDIIEQYGADALRYVICELQTGSQDVRLPVQAISPFTGNPIDLAHAKHGRNEFTYLCPESGNEFDVLGTMPDLPAAKLVSDRFEVGRQFCTKLWNFSRFALMNLDGVAFRALGPGDLEIEDRWILSRLSRACREVEAQLRAYNPSAAIQAARTFFWSEACDWYAELAKPRMRDDAKRAVAQQVLAFVLDHILRLLHPFVPFITEELWGHLGSIAPERGIGTPVEVTPLLVHARFAKPDSVVEDEALEQRMDFVQALIREIRSVRAKYDVPPRMRVDARVRATAARMEPVRGLEHLITHMANIERLEISPEAERSPTAATAVVGDVEIYIEGAIDLDKERERLEKQREQLEKAIGGARKKLENQNFVSRAPAPVVQAERDRLHEAELELTGVEQSLAALG